MLNKKVQPDIEQLHKLMAEDDVYIVTILDKCDPLHVLLCLFTVLVAAAIVFSSPSLSMTMC